MDIQWDKQHEHFRFLIAGYEIHMSHEAMDELFDAVSGVHDNEIGKVVESAPCACGSTAWVIDDVDFIEYEFDWDWTTKVHCQKCKAEAEWMGD